LPAAYNGFTRHASQDSFGQVKVATLQERITTTSRGSVISVQAIYVPAEGRRTD
jgi:F0F1-type ATP synthase beta subunit